MRSHVGVAPAPGRVALLCVAAADGAADDAAAEGADDDGAGAGDDVRGGVAVCGVGVVARAEAAAAPALCLGAMFSSLFAFSLLLFLSFFLVLGWFGTLDGIQWLQGGLCIYVWGTTGDTSRGWTEEKKRKTKG